MCTEFSTKPRVALTGEGIHTVQAYAISAAVDSHTIINVSLTKLTCSTQHTVIINSDNPWFCKYILDRARSGKIFFS